MLVATVIVIYIVKPLYTMCLTSKYYLSRVTVFSDLNWLLIGQKKHYSEKMIFTRDSHGTSSYSIMSKLLQSNILVWRWVWTVFELKKKRRKDKDKEQTFQFLNYTIILTLERRRVSACSSGFVQVGYISYWLYNRILQVH